MSLGIIAFMMGSLLIMFVGVTRIVAETGIVFLDLPSKPMISPWPSSDPAALVHRT